MNSTLLYECWFCNWLLSLDADKQKFNYFIIIIIIIIIIVVLAGVFTY